MKQKIKKQTYEKMLKQKNPKKNVLENLLQFSMCFIYGRPLVYFLALSEHMKRKCSTHIS